MLFIISSLFFLAGFTSLVYEVAWLRMLSNSLGTSAYTLSTVLAVFMAGMALGSWVFGRLADRYPNPLRTFAWLELGISVLAFLVPFLIMPMNSLYLLIAPYVLQSAAFGFVKFLMAFLVLLLPATLMGGAFPLIAKAVTRQVRQAGSRAAIIASVNTFGAVAGALMTGFYFIRVLGVRETAWLAALLNLVAAAAAYAVSREWKPSSEAVAASAPAAGDDAAVPEQKYTALLVGTAAFVSGACALSYQVVWTRMLAIVYANITYSFSLILACFLGGLALGSLIAAFFADRARPPLVILGAIEALIGLSGFASLFFFNSFATTPGNVYPAFGGEQWGAYIRTLSYDTLFIMLVPTILMGMVIPVAVRAAAPAMKRLGADLGRLYSINTLGALLGSVGAGFVLIPLFGDFQGTVLFIALANVLIGCVLLAYARQVKVWLKIVLCLCVAGILTLEISLADMHTPFVQKAGVLAPDAEILYHEEGPTLTVTVTDDHGRNRKVLYTDGFRMAGTGPEYAYMRMLAHLPALLVPGPQKALVVGFGTGTTSGTFLHHSLPQLDIVEIAPEVIRAAPYFADANNDVADPDKRTGPTAVRVIIEDGKTYLLASPDTYDIIVAEPAIPYMVGAIHLYCKDFYEACRDRLSARGVFCLWVPLQTVRAEDYKLIMRTFADVFPETSMWYFREATVLIGSTGRQAIDFSALEAGMAQPEMKGLLSALDIDTPFSLLASFVMGTAQMKAWTGPGELLTENHPSIEFYSPYKSIQHSHRDNVTQITAYREPAVPFLKPIAGRGLRWYVRNRMAKYYAARTLIIEGRILYIQKKLWEAIDKYKAAINLFPGDEYAKRLLEETLEMVGAKEAGTKIRVPREKGIQGMQLYSGRKAYGPLSSEEVMGLLDMLDSEDWNVRFTGLDLLAEISEKEIASELLDLLDDPNINVQLKAIYAMAKLQAQAAVPALVKCLESADKSVRAVAAKVLPGFEDPSAVPALVAALRDAEPAVRAVVLESLMQLTKNDESFRFNTAGSARELETGVQKWEEWQHTRAN